MDQNLREQKKRGSFLFPLELHPTLDRDGTFYVSCHWHPDIEIIDMQEGHIRLFIDGQPTLVSKDTIIFINQEQLHHLNSLEAGTRYNALVFPAELLSFDMMDYCQQKYLLPLIQKKLLFPSFLTPEHPAFSSVRTALASISRLCKEEPSGYQLSIKAALFELLAALIREDSLIAAKGQTSSGQQKRLDTMRSIVSYLEDHLCEKISLETISAAYYMSPNYFGKFFKRCFGQNFTQYLNGLRLEKACLLLQDTNLPIMEVSLQCGFENLSYFVRLFKKEKGIPPSAYRKKFADP